ncbi:ubiquitin, putative [Ichthyophthirius multifiliis]|uniref:Ubiquitin, putative n=1 Tax=Ichthyophthirius multifiliis TaxID=5932 RepID=G0QN96_ICHMU|nr:ubiquitin, putative [Ichthyophthirius multifiliis]EGR33307.1 ubiquitin, putative [Ichthyophthirius multifiliis]|eukprot:XP_004037293.1 ubiquitin, putative [Ichthyophthirius multifiliis]
METYINLPKCKQKNTRQKVFEFLLVLGRSSNKNYFNFLQCIQYNSQQLQHEQKDLNINNKPKHGFVGLKNFGCTCYINSLLQQFFMMKDLRNFFINQPLILENNQQQDQQKEQNINQLDQNISYQLKHLFIYMQESIKQYIQPFNFICSIRSYDGEPINVLVQQDVNEFFHLLTDKIDNEFKNTNNKQMLQTLIGGTLCNQLISLESEYPYCAETFEPFLTISLDIQNCSNIEQAMDAFVKGDTLEGSNKYYCENYGRKLKAQKKVYVNQLSNNLIITLKRFEFDYQLMQKKKINDYFEFTLSLNISKWAFQNEEQQVDPNYYQYDLVGILVHSGTAESGHYYSYIMNREDKNWYEFNDTQVTEFNINKLKEECFGGQQNNNNNNYYGFQNVNFQFFDLFNIFFKQNINRVKMLICYFTKEEFTQIMIWSIQLKHKKIVNKIQKRIFQKKILTI